MNDPHVVAVIYRLKHDAFVKYDKAEPLEHDTPEFTVRVSEGEARFEMKKHFGNVEAAREMVAPFIRAWEVTAALDEGPGHFELIFKNGDIEDRKPTPGIVNVVRVETILMAESVSIVLGKGHYPEPPSGIVVNADVEAMLSRYTKFRQDRETLAGMAYFCLTVLVESAGGRAPAAGKFNVAGKVLSTLGRLTGEKGGADARKVKGLRHEFTPAERDWLDLALRKLIRRAAEVAYDPAQSRPQITMADLQKLN